MELSPEQELLLTCARVDLSSRHQQRLEQLTRQSLCWESIGRAANAHGITSLLDRHLRPIVRQVCPEQVCPESVWRTWHWQSLGVLANNLRLVAELSAIGTLLDEAKIPYLCLKGPALAASCYGDLRLRPACDLDLLVRPADAEQADGLLMGRGFRPQFRLTGYQWQTFIRTRCELAYRRDEPTVMVELHWSLTSPGYSFTPSIQACWQRAEQIRIESFPVSTLGPEDNFLFLGVHAAKHQWQRLIWLVDLAELIRQRSNMDWDRVLTPSTLRSAGRPTHVSLRLASRLLEAPVPDHVWQRLGTDRVADRIVQRVIDRHLVARSPIDKNSREFPWQTLYFQAMPLRRDRLRFLYEVLLQPTPIEWALLPLPRWLTPVYHVIRPIRLLYRHLLRKLRIGGNHRV